MSPDDDRVTRTLHRLDAWRKSLPKWHSFPIEYVTEYHGLLNQLRDAGIDVAEFYVPDSQLARVVTGGNYVTGETRYSDEPHARGDLLLGRLDGVIGYLRESKPKAAPPKTAPGRVTITGGNVTFGEGAHINISTVTIGDFLHALEKHVEAQVSDPTEKRSILGRISDLLKHPAATTVIQTALPEILKQL